MSPRNVPQAEAFFWGYGLQIVTGRRYLEGFVGTNIYQSQWMGGNIVGWRDLVATLDGLARRYLHTAYTVLQKSLQQEWAFLHSFTLCIRVEFQAM